MAAARICMGRMQTGWARRSAADLPLCPARRAKMIQMMDVRRERGLPGQEMIDTRHRALLLLRPPGRQRPRLADGGNRVLAKIIVGVGHGSMLCGVWQVSRDNRCVERWFLSASGCALVPRTQRSAPSAVRC